MEISEQTMAFLESNCPMIYRKLSSASVKEYCEKSCPSMQEVIAAKQATCHECDGVHCGQPTRGFYPRYVRDPNGTEREVMTMCKVEKARRKQEKIDRLMEGAGLPPYLEGLAWDDFQELNGGLKEAKMTAKMAGEGWQTGIFFHGPKGTGKTMLAYLIAKERIKRGTPTMFVFVPELLGKYRAAYHDANMEDPSKIAKDADLLILDDIGAERATAWVAEQLMELINYRYSNRLQTIFTSNYSLQELAEHLAAGGDVVSGERIASRIMGMTVAIPVTGEDWRARE